MVGIGAIVVLFIVLQPGGGDPVATSTPTQTETPEPKRTSAGVTSPATETTGPTPTEPSGSPTRFPTASPIESPTPTGPDFQVIRGSFEGGEVRGPGTARVKLGSRVEIVVTADVEEEVHVHGYDLTADVARGRAARIRFRADIAGQFEVELEGSHRLLFRLEVAP